MNFARQQEQAERTGRRLRWLHAIACATMVIAVDAVATLLWHAAFGAGIDPPHGFHAVNVGVVLLLVVGGSWIETARLREDGALIARRLGAVPVDTLADPLHRRLQNVLEELAIAARIGVPRGFVLEDEPSINALTAGMDRNQSVVVVTRGALSRLTRAELQGVLAHEISHVVNGDVRLNTRLVGLNHGLRWVSLFGRSLLSDALTGHARESLGHLLVAPLRIVAGAVLASIGAIGELAARLTQAGVGRQREYFADAQAVAFTRDRNGIGGALRKVAGQTIAAQRGAAGDTASQASRRAASRRHPYWRNVAHLLLISDGASRSWFDTHPPLRERVRRLYGAQMPPIDPAELGEAGLREPDLPAIDFERAQGASANASAAPTPDAAGGVAAVPPGEGIVGAAVGASNPASSAAWSVAAGDRATDAPGAAAGDAPTVAAGTAAGDAPTAAAAAATARLIQATREPASAAALLVALVELPGQSQPAWDEGWALAASRLGAVRTAVAALTPAQLRPLRWPLMELAVARLRPLSRPSRDALLVTVRALVEADGRVSLREWTCLALLRLRLAPHPAGARLVAPRHGIDVRSIRLLFALVARTAHVSDARADRAANAAIRALDLAPIGASPGPLTLDALEGALRHAACLPPLARPLLVRHLAAMLPHDAGPEVRDFLRLLCVAIDCPPPQLSGHGRASRVEEDDEALVGAGG